MLVFAVTEIGENAFQIFDKYLIYASSIYEPEKILFIKHHLIQQEKMLPVTNVLFSLYLVSHIITILYYYIILLYYYYLTKLKHERLNLRNNSLHIIVYKFFELNDTNRKIN